MRGTKSQECLAGDELMPKMGEVNENRRVIICKITTNFQP